MNTKSIIVTGFLAASFLLSCGSESTEKKENTEKNETPEEETVIEQQIETPGYEGTIGGPGYITLREYHSDQDGNVTDYPLVEIDHDLSFTIEMNNLSLDSLKKITENDWVDKFIDYAVDEKDYFISRAENRRSNEDPLIKLGFVITKGDKKYQIVPMRELKSVAEAETIMEYARTYQPK